MIKRYGFVDWEAFDEKDNGLYVLYTDHLARVHDLVVLCLDHGIISRGIACYYLGCAREELDGVLHHREEDSDG